MASFTDTLKTTATSYSLANASIISATPATTELSTENLIRSDKYDWYEKYQDSVFSSVSSVKDIKVDESQINITQEDNSQYIPFKMPRYWDGIDLMEMSIKVRFVNKNGEEGLSVPKNVQYNDTTIVFHWLVDINATFVSGELKFEIFATGVNEKGENYVWRTKPNGKLNILEALTSNSSAIEPDSDWTMQFIREMDAKIGEAQAASVEAQNAATQAQNTATELQGRLDTIETEIDTKVANAVVAELENYYTKKEVDQLFEDFDISDQLQGIQDQIDNMDGLANFDVKYDSATQTLTFLNGEVPMKNITLDMTPKADWTASYNQAVDSKISEANTSLKTEMQKEIADAVAGVDVTEQLEELEQVISETYYDKETIDGKLINKADTSVVNSMKTDISNNTTNTTAISNRLAEIEEVINNVNTDPSKRYYSTYDATTGEYKLIEVTTNADETETETVVSQHIIQGGGGGSSSSSTITIDRVTQTPAVALKDDETIPIVYNFTSVDSSNDDTGEGTAVWKVGSTVVATTLALQGENTFDLKPYVSVGTHKVTLTITDAMGSVSMKNWTVQVIDIKLESTFNDTYTYPLGELAFAYTPYGAISKTVHFILDGEELDSVTTSASGVPMSYTLPAKEHGAHLLEAYITADINNSTIETNHIYKDILWYDSTSDVPVIGTIYQDFKAKQYDSTNIIYTVYDPKTETPTVTLAVDGNDISTLTLESSTNTWTYKSIDVGEHILTITCRDTVKTLKVNIEKLDIEVTPVTANLAFDFNPTGYSNNDANRLWTNGTVSMSVSDNFDWVNGGYQLDANGDQYFCIKAGTTAEIDYQLFADDSKKNGKEFKLIFKTTNVSNGDTTFLTCVDNTTDTNHIGIRMDAHEAFIYAQSGNLPLPYAEDEIIEFEFNISKSDETVPMVMGYEDGVSTRPLVYDGSHSFTQTNPKTIALGSPDLDLHIYRFKVYSTSLSDRDILNNFIADARNAEEMISRYNRNQIYDENSLLDPDVLATKCPQLRVIKIECPRFTTDKDDKVGGTKIQCIYKDGDPALDNWTAFDCVHSGQGTSSNNYGPAGRNLDLIMKTYKDMGNQPYIVLGDSNGTRVSKVSLTRDSIPTNYFNVKVNIASSENTNNAYLAYLYNKFNPYNRAFVREDATEIPKIKDTMEFQNCVIFLKETDDTITNHTEFADKDWHFYAIGNIGDSKKTDSTRLTDPDDIYECILEVMDNTLPNSTMPTGKVDETGAPVYPISEEEWCEGNSAYDSLYDDWFDEKSAAKKGEGHTDDTYGWRYIYEDGTDEQNAEVKAYIENQWKEFYKFVVTSSDEDFKAHLGDWVVLDSVMYYYLFTLYFTMTDNHAKNSFWHYGKTGEVDADKNPIRKWDLCFDYDNDTALGIDNYGRMTYRYGYEEIDFVDGTSDWVWNAPQHVFFLRLRELFNDELCALYTSLESLGCWNAQNILNDMNRWQAQFPEELWRVDIERKYIRTYTGSYINGAPYVEFLTERANGRKKTQRTQFLKNQEKYMASKFGGTVASSDDIVLRCSVPNANLVITPNFDLKLTPYSYIYLNVKYNTSPPVKIRAVPNVEYTIPYTGELADIIEIYSASCLKNLGDLSATYLINGNFSNASKIRELILGNATEGYDNTNSMTLGLGANTLLNKLDIQNMSGLTHSLDLSVLKNLIELYAHGSNVSGITFANGGLIEIAELPAITSITMKNLSYLTTLDIESLDKLTTMTIENCTTVDSKYLLENAENVNRVRLTNIDWELEDTSLLQDIYEMNGIDAAGYNTDQSVLSGAVFVPVVKEQELYNFNTTWTDLAITYNTLVNQFSATFINDDGTVLDVQYVDKGTAPVDPLTRENNPIATPTKESSVSEDFTFDSWDSELTALFSNVIITATYTSSPRKYTIKYVSKNNTLQETVAEYGTTVFYEGELPTYTAEEAAYKYYLFTGWDKSGFVTGDKTINAVFDSCEYVSGYFDGKALSELRPVEIYAMVMLESSRTLSVGDYLTDGDDMSLTLGHDYDYDDVESVEIISEKTTFNGKTHIDTGINLFEEDKDFILAIDFELVNGNTANAVLAECFQANGSNGFKLWFNGSAKLTWGTSSHDVTSLDNREMLVIRHVKGDNNLYIYSSNLSGDEIYAGELTRTKTTSATSSLVLGCSQPEEGYYENYALGTINWCKLWWADLGDTACKELASWTHEKVTLEVCGFKRYYLSDNPSKRCSFSVLATHLLERARNLNALDSNAGGWAETTLNTFLNTRLYNAVPLEWKPLIKQVQISSSVGEKSTEISTSDCYITIPAVIEVDPSMSSDPYQYEGSPISYMTTNDARKRAYDGGDYAIYWTRSPNIAYGNYFYVVQEDGSTWGYNSPQYQSLGILIELSI